MGREQHCLARVAHRRIEAGAAQRREIEIQADVEFLVLCARFIETRRERTSGVPSAMLRAFAHKVRTPR